MDAAIAAGHAGLVGGLGEGCPLEDYGFRGRETRFDFGASSGQGSRVTKAVASRPEFEDARGSRAVGAVAGNKVWERRRRRSRKLVGYPLRAVHFNRALAGAAPSANALAVEQYRNCRGRANGVVGALGVPSGDAGV